MDIIKTVELTKKFGDFIADNRVNLSVRENEIKAIVGENGAGKTTLMNMLFGLVSPTSGHVEVQGKRVVLRTPLDAMLARIGMVHQHFKLVPGLTVYENILLGVEEEVQACFGKRNWKLPLIDKRRSLKLVDQLIDKFKFNIPAKDLVKNLSVGAMQKVEILKMLYRDVDVLIFDEPTAVLTPQEIEGLFQSMRELKQQGKTIILITHKLREVMEISDSVTVLRAGSVVGNLETCKTNEKELARLMVGRDVLLTVNRPQISPGTTIYQVQHLVANDKSGCGLQGVSFAIAQGEVLGVAGVEGNGQSALVRVLTGLMTCSSGRVRLKGQDVTNSWPRRLRDLGIGIIPEDRYAEGSCRTMPLWANCVAGYHWRFSRWGLLRRKEILRLRDRLLKEYDVRTSDGDAPLSSLSGGNAQKLIIAREFSFNPELLIAAQPTRGVDIGAIEFIYQSVMELKKRRKAILLISSDLQEIISLSDRIVVMFRGRIVGELAAASAKQEEIGLLMAGVSHSAEDLERENG